jgi:hypothetical protein
MEASETINLVASGQTFVSEPTPQLRWAKSGELQQGWAVTEYAAGKPVDRKLEWRGIPAEESR